MLSAVGLRRTVFPLKRNLTTCRLPAPTDTFLRRSDPLQASPASQVNSGLIAVFSLCCVLAAAGFAWTWFLVEVRLTPRINNNKDNSFPVLPAVAPPVGLC